MKWRYLGLVPGVVALAYGLFSLVFVIPALLGHPKIDVLWYMIPMAIAQALLPGAILLGIYWAAVRASRSKRREAVGLVMGIVLLGLGIAALAYWYWWHGNLGIWLTLGCLAPGVLVVGGYFLSRTGNRNSATVWAVTLPFAAILAVITFGGFLVGWMASPVYRVASYERLVKSQMTVREGKLVGHFPSKIPSDAKRIRLYYRPRVLQGGSSFQLRYQTDSAHARAVLSKFTPVAKGIYDGSPHSFYYANDDNGLSTASFRDEYNRRTAPLPTDFKVLVLSVPPYDPNGWNHSYSSGVAVSTKRNEVIYWAEDW